MKLNNCWNCFYNPPNRTKEQGNFAGALCYHPEWLFKTKSIFQDNKIGDTPKCWKELENKNQQCEVEDDADC
jgi:hypothetical protein